MDAPYGKNVLDRVLKDFGYLGDGYVYWFPGDIGGADARFLRWVASLLDEKNREWDREIDIELRLSDEDYMDDYCKLLNQGGPD